MKGSSDPNRVLGYEFLLKSLEEYKGDKVNIRLLKGADVMYIVFLSVNPFQFIGTLKLINPNGS